MKSAVVFLADGFEEIEALSPVDYLRRAGVKVTLLAVCDKGLLVRGAHDITVQADVNINDYADSLPDLVLVPGGMPGATNLASSSQVKKLIEDSLEKKSFVAAICAAPAVVLPSTGVLKGKKWTCYPGMKDYDDLSSSYASCHVDGVPFVTDGNLITGRGPGAAEQFSMELVRLLCGQEVSEKIKKASVQR